MWDVVCRFGAGKKARPEDERRRIPMSRDFVLLNGGYQGVRLSGLSRGGCEDLVNW